MAYPPKVPFITGQPQQYDIHSNFGMFPGERLLYHCEMKSGCCKFGDQYFTSVTNTRYVARHEQCICCGKKPYVDTCIYLNDIAQLDETRDGICWCCTRKDLQLRGSFGSHRIHISDKDMPDFELMISETIAQHKLLKH